MTRRNGYAVAIRREDGSEFFASAGIGILPAVWPLSARDRATAHKREMVESGFKARVVRVEFHEVQQVTEVPRG